MIRVGDFEIEVTDPYPCWIYLRRDGKEIRLSHAELADLSYAIAKASHLAKQRLGNRAHEVMEIK